MGDISAEKKNGSTAALPDQRTSNETPSLLGGTPPPGARGAPQTGACAHLLERRRATVRGGERRAPQRGRVPVKLSLKSSHQQGRRAARCTIVRVFLAVGERPWQSRSSVCRGMRRPAPVPPVEMITPRWNHLHPRGGSVENAGTRCSRPAARERLRAEVLLTNLRCEPAGLGSWYKARDNKGGKGLLQTPSSTSWSGARSTPRWWR